MPSPRVCSPLLLALVVVMCATGLVRLAAAGEERITPVLQSVPSPPVAFPGSDGRTHLVYELWLWNASGGDAHIESVEVLGDGQPLLALDRAAIAGRLRPSGTLASSVQGLLFLHMALPPGAATPRQLTHQVAVRALAAPPGQQDIRSTGGETPVDVHEPVVIGPPLRGERFISADGCCDAVRHTRAALPVNGRLRVAQRFAVDWEQLDDSGRLYSGPRGSLHSYTIYGREALAVADARVASVVDGRPEQTPGRYPEGISLEEADGNSVILNLGGGRYALYAHLQPGSLRVKAGDRVARGQVLGLVGNSGNSVAPHLHFHVMDGPSALDANGLPYLLDAFVITGASPGTEAFDHAEAEGTPLAIQPVTPPRRVTRAHPLDQQILSF
ncbi:MAG: M23 family metallopeptidase [Verrucomicrobia bacterium]|nr:M23 family metallopeptidase [Verrucomicrobiota bacterium]